MPSTEEMIREIEEEIKNTKYNKATQHHIGKLKAKLARLKDLELRRSSSKVKSAGFSFKKTGDATVVIVGFPSVGKSTLINKLTNVESKVGHYDFTTLDVIPGMLKHNHARIQLIDLPGIIVGASKSRGKGRKILSVAQNADLILILAESFAAVQVDLIKKELYEFGIRLDSKKPDVSIKKRAYGGIRVSYTFKDPKLDEAMIKSMLQVYRINNADLIIREDVDEDKFIDVVLDNRIYVLSVVVINKIDIDSSLQFPKDNVLISAQKELGLLELKDVIYSKLDFIRLYMKPHGGKPDFDEPLIIKRNSKIRDVCNQLHREFTQKFRYAQIIRKGQKTRKKVGLGYTVADEDIVTIVTKR